MTDGAPYIARRPKRADGARNYDAILASARRSFENNGANASLEEIAGEAGVAIGTLYRHFPNRASLIEATTRDGLGHLVARAEHLSRERDPLEALIEWLQQAVRHFSTFRGLVGILAQSMYDEGTPSHQMCSAMHESGATLLRTAQKAGRVRADLSTDELFDLLHGVAWVRENTPAHHDHSDRLLALLLEGLTTGVGK